MEDSPFALTAADLEDSADDPEESFENFLRPFRKHLLWSLALAEFFPEEDLTVEVPSVPEYGPGPIEREGRPRLEDMPLYHRWADVVKGNYADSYKRAAQGRLDDIQSRWQSLSATWDEQVAAERNAAVLAREQAEAEADAARVAIEYVDRLRERAAEGDLEALASLARVRLSKHLVRALGYNRPIPETSWSQVNQELGVQVEIPTFAQYPRHKSIRESERTGEISISYLSGSELKNAYTRYIAEVALGAANAAFVFTTASVVSRVVIEILTDSPNPATGKQEQRTLLSLIMTREEWAELVLSKVDPVTCVKSLTSRVSPRPDELVPVQPLARVYGDDERFVDGEELLSTFDNRPNLMELTPTEFESLVQNLFEKMGLETRQTRASRDGGVDAIAYDPRPLIGGKIVIQAKRYKNPVGVSAVRDLYGTLQNEGGSKGILVTTSRYGRASFDFAKDKPLELVDGPGLLHLLKEHAGLDARIIPPTDWVDPIADS